VSELLGFTQAFAAGILALAAVTKVAARVDLAPFLVTVGVPGRLARVLAPAVAPAEAILAVLLATGVAAAGVTMAALALSLAFVGAQVKSFRNTQSEGCRCFGHLDSNEKASALVGAALLAGSLLLASLAVVTGGAPGDTATRTWGTLTGIGAVVALALIGQVLGFQRERPRVAEG